MQDIWIDGTQPLNGSGSHCPVGSDTWTEIGDGDVTAVFAVNCLLATYHSVGNYYRNNDSDIFLNSDNIAYSWSVQSGTPPSARGVLTHEIGHGATLVDVYGSACTVSGLTVTMCGAVTDAQTWFYYTLTDDDKTSANLTYLP